MRLVCSASRLRSTARTPESAACSGTSIVSAAPTIPATTIPTATQRRAAGAGCARFDNCGRSGDRRRCIVMRRTRACRRTGATFRGPAVRLRELRERFASNHRSSCSLRCAGRSSALCQEPMRCAPRCPTTGPPGLRRGGFRSNEARQPLR